MIQFNLLPSVKREYVSTRRNKRITLMVAVIVAGTALAIMIMLFIGVQLVQKNYSSDLSADIKSQTNKLKETPEIDKVLTIQNQLNSVTGLHDEKPVATRLLDFIKQLTPAKVSIANLNIDFAAETISITGSADTISTVNTFVDTIKFTTYKTEDGKEGNAFSSVVMASFDKAEDGATYVITLKYDPIIFKNASPVTLTVPPGKITTRSETEKPEALFQPLSNPSEAQ